MNERDREDPSKLFPLAEATNKGRRSYVVSKECVQIFSASGFPFVDSPKAEFHAVLDFRR